MISITEFAHMGPLRLWIHKTKNFEADHYKTVSSNYLYISRNVTGETETFQHMQDHKFGIALNNHFFMKFWLSKTTLQG